MKELFDLLAVCKKNGIHFTLDGDRLKMQGKVGALCPEEISMVKRYKDEIIGLLRKPAHDEIPLLGVQESCELSSAQKRMWVLSKLGAAYHITMSNVFEGTLDVKQLSNAFEKVIERHEILRTVFKEDASGEVRQYVLAEKNINISDEPVSFDLENGPLMHATLSKISESKWTFTLVMHHIISDGWSMDIIIRDLMQAYQGLALPPLPIQYKDYAAWQQRQPQETHRAYWLKQFEGELPVLQLPADKPRPAIQTYHGGQVQKIIGSELTAALKAIARQQECTLFMALLVAVQAVLYRYTFQQDIIIGTPVAGRDRTELEDQAGLYMNTLALRTACTGNESFTELLSRIKTLVLEAQAHQSYPFDLLVDELKLNRDRSRNALFDVMVTVKEDVFKTVEIEGLRISEHQPQGNVMSKFDLSFNFTDRGDVIELQLLYNSDIYFESTAERIAKHLVQILSAALKGESQYLTDEEVHQLVVGFNNAQAVFPEDKTVVDLFGEQVARTPDRAALVFGEISLTYRELDERTDQLAACLNNELIAVMLDRSVEVIVAILAIMKSGGAYVPIDPEYPAARIAYLLKDSGARILLTATHYLPRFSGYDGTVIAIDGKIETKHFEKPVVQPHDLAYVIYTSGSTGQPKGVMISHRSLVDYFYGIMARTNISECRHFGLVSTIAADLGNTVIYTSLFMGGTLHIYSATDLMDAEQIFNGQLDCIKIVPSHWKSLQPPGKVLLPEKCLVFGGESLTPDVLEKIKSARHHCEVFNHYGPSEATIGKLITHIDFNNIPVPVPLGAPFCQSSFYIVDHREQLVPIGVIGEICIAGAGLAKGYFNRPELTAEKFVANPFVENDRMYKTGDLGRWLPDGKIEFIGRKDDQVKIRGYRVEIGEIEAAIRTHDDIESAVVLPRLNANNEKELIAYLTGKPGLVTADIRSRLARTLPAYMIPAHFILLDKIPLTLNGKIDKRALPEPESSELPIGTPYVPPRNETEEKLVEIWQELLNKQQVGIKDNFFEAGGHSLKMMQLIARINRSFSLRINIQSIFNEPTIENIAEQIFFILDQNKQKANRRNLKQVEI